MNSKNLKWIYLIALSIVWGSSFILIKKSLVGLTALQVGSFRIIFAAIFLLIFGFGKLKDIKLGQWKWITISGLLGSFFPVYFFAFAETEIDSAIASILNATTPLLTMTFGFLFFKAILSFNKVFGVLVGLAGTLGLILSGASINPEQNYWFSLLVISATICYAFNVNILKRYLNDVSVLGLTTGSFTVLLIPALIVLYFTGFFEVEQFTSETKLSIVYISILGVVNTGLAKIIFNRLVQISDPVFTSSVTYTIPVVAVGWGILDGEVFGFWQIVSAFVILVGVFIVNRSKRLMSGFSNKKNKKSPAGSEAL